MKSTVKGGPAVLTLKEVADYLKLSEMTILRLANKGIIPGAKLGRQWRFSGEVVADLIRHPEIMKKAGARK